MRPPIYHFSGPPASLKPSDELSEPRRCRVADPPSGVLKPGDPGEPGDREYGDAECWRVGWNWPVVWMATVVAPVLGVPAFVAIARGFEGAFVEVVAAGAEVDVGASVEAEAVDAVVLAALGTVVLAVFCIAEWALNAARKLEKKGRLVVGIVSAIEVSAAGLSVLRSSQSSDLGVSKRSESPGGRLPLARASILMLRAWLVTADSADS